MGVRKDRVLVQDGGREGEAAWGGASARHISRRGTSQEGCGLCDREPTASPPRPDWVKVDGNRSGIRGMRMGNKKRDGQNLVAEPSYPRIHVHPHVDI